MYSGSRGIHYTAPPGPDDEATTNDETTTDNVSRTPNGDRTAPSAESTDGVAADD